MQHGAHGGSSDRAPQQRELFAIDAERLRIVVWSNSRTANNVRVRRRAMLTFVHRDQFTHVRVSVGDIDEVEIHGRSMRMLTARVESVEADQAAYAEITSGIQFHLLDGGVDERWSKRRN